MQIDRSWTLFLDRDGVLNERIPDAYINHWDDFRFTRGALPAMQILRERFGRILLVTNQQGIGRRIMTQAQLDLIHRNMQEALAKAGASIDAIYVSPDLRSKPNNTRKPAPAMGLQAKADFPEIDFARSMMVGDSISDLQFGRNLGMKTVLITSKQDEAHLWPQHEADWDLRFSSLAEFAKSLG